MKNLSLQMAESASLRKSSEAMSKSNVNSENSTLTVPNTSFQMMLNKQVQTKQVSVQQVQTTKPQTSKPTAKEMVAKPAANEQKSATNTLNTKQGAESAKDKKAAIATEALAASIISPQVASELDKNPLLATKNDEDSKVEDVVDSIIDSAEQTNIPISAPILMLGMNATAIDLTQSALTTSPANVELTSATESSAQKQRNMDSVLSNALSNGKNIAPEDAGGQHLQVGSDENSQSNKTSWIDEMLPNTVKQPSNDESASAKLMLSSIKDDANKDKDVGMKDLTMSASYQPAPKINVAEAIQQIASSNTINAYPGKTGWDQAISQKVVWMLGANEQSATLTLNPPDMGPLQVVIHVHNDRADTTFISDNAEVRQALQDGMANLRDKMNESGIQLGQANVNSGGQMQQQFQQASQQNGSGSQLNNNGTASQVEVDRVSQRLMRVANGLVDTFA